jgi:hypothetical protein
MRFKLYSNIFKKFLSVLLPMAIIANQPFLLCFAQNPQSVKHIEHFSDGWKLINRPQKVERHDTFAPFVNIDITSHPIDANLSADSHPMAHMLNQYQVIEVHPNQTRVNWQNNVNMAQRLPKTDHIVNDIRSSLPKHTNIFTQGLEFLIRLPYYIFVSVLCFPAIPFMVTSAGDEIIAYKKSRLYKNIVAKIQTFSSNLDKLQQVFEPDQQLSNRYNVLPSRYNYNVDLIHKVITYNQYGPNVYITLVFKNPLPTAEEIKSAFNASTFSKTGKLMTSTSAWDQKEIETTLQLPPGLYIKSCTVNYRNEFKDSIIDCESVQVESHR